MIDPQLLAGISDDLTDEQKFVWRGWIRQLPLFAAYAAWFTDLEDRLDAAVDTIRAKALNYLEPQIKRYPGEFTVSGGEDGVRMGIPTERHALVREGLLALYDDDPDLIALIMSEDGAAIIGVTDGTAGGQLAVGQTHDPVCPLCFQRNACGHFR